MTEETKPFENKYSSYKAINEIEEKKRDIVSVEVNQQFRAMLEEDKKLLERTFDAPTIRELAIIGHYAIHDGLTEKILMTVFDNKRKNKRLGIIDFE